MKALTPIGIITNLELISQQGGNSEVYKGQIQGRFVVYKRSIRSNPKQRALREFSTLTRLNKYAPTLTPLPLCLDDQVTGFVMSFEPGQRPLVIDRPLVQAMGLFMQYIQKSLEYDKDQIPLATDNLLDDAFGIKQLNRRYRELSDYEVFDQANISKKLCKLIHEYETLSNNHRNMHRSNPIFSPSDFGLHNVVFNSESKLYKFLDFEYAGLDVVEKLLADTLLHPQNRWSVDSTLELFSLIRKKFIIDFEYLTFLLTFAKINWALIAIRREVKSPTNQEFSGFPCKTLDRMTNIDELMQESRDLVQQLRKA